MRLPALPDSLVRRQNSQHNESQICQKGCDHRSTAAFPGCPRRCPPSRRTRQIVGNERSDLAQGGPRRLPRPLNEFLNNCADERKAESRDRKRGQCEQHRQPASPGGAYFRGRGFGRRRRFIWVLVHSAILTTGARKKPVWPRQLLANHLDETPRRLLNQASMKTMTRPTTRPTTTPWVAPRPSPTASGSNPGRSPFRNTER